ncbi:uncharacterized protein LOC134717692 [Mytilus trossulus]|uniref:uncharacterized protein LOC134717692 n=1 Tax=Mytilus trossulus TaxID=6551 RepID=UPI003003BE32
MFIFDLFVFASLFSSVKGVVCYKCQDSDLSTCNSIVECRSNEICHGHRSNISRYTLDCIPKTICDQFIIGKRELTAGCCSTNYCNKKLFDMQTVSTRMTTSATEQYTSTFKPTSGVTTKMNNTKTIPRISTTTNVMTSTTKPTTNKPISCMACTGPSFLCERLYTPILCSDPNKPLCLTEVANLQDGSRTVIRRCGTESECQRDWWKGSSDNDKCTNFDANFIYTLHFQCIYCCTTYNCNVGGIPAKSTLYIPYK